jgi:hypothetical protein
MIDMDRDALIKMTGRTKLSPHAGEKKIADLEKPETLKKEREYGKRHV